MARLDLVFLVVAIFDGQINPKVGPAVGWAKALYATPRSRPQKIKKRKRPKISLNVSRVIFYIYQGLAAKTDKSNDCLLLLEKGQLNVKTLGVLFKLIIDKSDEIRW